MPSRKVKISAAVVLTFAILLTVGFGAVYAYLSAADSSTNTFTPADSLDPSVSVSTSSSQVTASVTVTDAGYPVYVRAVVVVNWIKDGQICATPAGASYMVRTQNDWRKVGDFYYYTSAVTGLSDTIEVDYTTVDGYTVQAQVICQTIQAVGTTDDDSATAVFDAWGVDIDALKNQN